MKTEISIIIQECEMHSFDIEETQRILTITTTIKQLVVSYDLNDFNYFKHFIPLPFWFMNIRVEQLDSTGEKKPQRT